MNQVFKVALPGYNAETDTNPDHFSLFVDQRVDYVLIKEKLTNTISVSGSSFLDITHGLGYVPFCLVFAETSTGVWRKIFGRPIFDSYDQYFSVTSSVLRLTNDSVSAKNFSYHIFYDRIA